MILTWLIYWHIQCENTRSHSAEPLAARRSGKRLLIILGALTSLSARTLQHTKRRAKISFPGWLRVSYIYKIESSEGRGNTWAAALVSSAGQRKDFSLWSASHICFIHTHTCMPQRAYESAEKINAMHDVRFEVDWPQLLQIGRMHSSSSEPGSD